MVTSTLTLTGPALPRPAVRLTRRGRVVVIALALLLAAVALLLVAQASQAAPPAGPAVTVVVRPGDTLWSIAASYAPSRDPYRTIDEIRALNGISDFTIHPGQKLTLPRRS